MPVFDQGYQMYAGPRRGLGRRWIPVWREEAAPYLRKRYFILLLIVAFLPWLFGGVGLSFLSSQASSLDWAKEIISKLPKMDEAWVAKLLTLGWSNFLLAIVCVWAGSGLVARDRKEHTIEVFLGRALGPAQYLFAKGAALGVYLLFFTFVPVVFLVAFHVGLTGDISFLWLHSRTLWGTLLYTILGPGALVVFTLALSSLSRSPRVVGLALIGVLFFGPPASGIMWAITKSPFAWTFGILIELKALGYHCLGVAPDPEISALHSTLYFLALILFSLGILYVRFSKRGVLR